MEAIVVGDTISSAGSWSRPVRYGGVRFAKDFSLAPGYITMPMPTVSGSAALPSTIDILVNNQRHATTNVPSGPFALTNVPVVNGAGELNVVVRDLRGGEQVLSQSYYVSPSLLARGLSDFSAEAGAMRRNFGTQGDDYGPAFAAGSYRVGWTDVLTVGGQAEMQGSRQAGGMDAVGLLHGFALGRLAVAWARSDDGSGTGAQSGFHWTAGLERSTRRGGFSVGVQHFDAGFRQFAAASGERQPRDSVQIGSGIRLNDTFNAGMSFTRQTTWDRDDFAVLAASLGVRLPASASISFSANRFSGPNAGWSVGMSLLVPLEHGRSLSAASSRTKGGTVSTAGMAQALPPGPGLGWSVRTSDIPGRQAQGSLMLNTNIAQLQADVNAGRNNNAARLSRCCRRPTPWWRRPRPAPAW